VRQYVCNPAQQNLGAGDPLAIVFSDTGVGIGSFGTVGNTFTNFVLQPGIYQVHLSIDAVTPNGSTVQMFLNDAPGVGYQSDWYVSNLPGLGGNPTIPISGDRLLAAGSANTTLHFKYSLALRLLILAHLARPPAF
jgi:hypothetical protein